MTRELGLLQDRDHYLHPQWDTGDHLSGQEAHNLVAQEVEVDFGEGEEHGDHPFDPQLVGGRAVQGVLHVIDVVGKGTW